MYKLFQLLFLLFFMSINAQIHELGVFIGGSNYVGDVGLTTYIAPHEPAFGVLYKWNKSPRHSYRASYTQTTITANDLDSKEPGRNQRGYHFENSIKELSVGLEFNFFDFNLHEIKTKFTPYVYTGLSYLRYEELYVTSGQITKQSNTAKGTIAIPMTLGVKSNIFPHLILALEASPRYAFTDNIDGSNPKGNSSIAFGNINNNDWYVFTGMTLTYTFGNKPCYCAQ